MSEWIMRKQSNNEIIAMNQIKFAHSLLMITQRNYVYELSIFVHTEIV